GSITNGAGASVEASSWRSLLGAWLCARQPFGYGKRQAANYNAGVGGTPSWYGLVRMALDVVAKGPELVLIDFAVNDASAAGIGARSLGFAPAAEALIRRLRLECPAATLAINIFAWPDLYSGMDVNRRAARDRWVALAGQYGLKLYRWDTYLESLLGPGYNDAQVEAYLLAAGDVHPNDAGHDAIFDLISADFAGFSGGSLAALPGYYEAEAADYEHEPQIVLGKDLTRVGTWAVDGNSVTSATAGSTASFSGTFCSFGWDTGFGAGNGTLAWSLDGGAYTSVDLALQDVANKAVWNFARGAHTVTLKVVSGSIRINRFLAI
ncbi:MAG TPA: SGNH/GDSL hydrolase family protein, partial [Anaerolineales bacterium]